MKHSLPILFLLSIALLTFAIIQTCRDASPAVTFETTTMKLKDKTFTLEIADTDERRELGLMNRTSLPEDRGMIFIFAKPDKWGFWMKNTKIPLEVLFLDASGKIINIKPLKPHDETIISSDSDASYAIELNAGTSAKIGLKAGDALTLPEKILKR